VNGREWCGFAGDGNISNVRNLDIDKVGAADSLTGFVVVMVIIVIERIKLFKTRGSVKWVVDRSKRDVKAMSTSMSTR